MADPKLCRCGHYEREHTLHREFALMTCSGHTRAFPDDHEGEDEGREVSCMCLAFEEADDDR